MTIFDEIGVDLRYDSQFKNEYLLRWEEINAPLENELLIMFGIGTGMYVKQLLSNFTCKGNIIIVEPSIDIYNEAILDNDVYKLVEYEKLDIVIDDLSDKYFNNYLYNKLSDNKKDKIKVAVYPNYHIIYPEEYRRFLDVVDEVCDMVSAAEIVDNRFSEDIQRNIKLNEKKLYGSYSIADFARKVPKEMPVIIAASGPSLSKNISDLKRAKGKSFIVGLDSSLPALLKEGIVPDVYVSIDPTKIAKHFEDERVKNIPVIAVLQSPDHVIKNGQKYFFIFNGDEEILSSLKEKNIDVVEVPPLGSVANTAFTLMNMIGFKTIIFVGQDLAYTDDKYHADNTVHNEKTFKHDTIIYLPGINGDEVKSSREFRMYKSGFEKIIEMFPEHRFIDSTEGGAYITGTDVKKLSDVINEYCVKEWKPSEYFEDIEYLFQNSAIVEADNVKKRIYELSEELVKSGNGKIVDEIFKCISESREDLSESLLYIFYQVKRLYITNVIERTRGYYDLYEQASSYWRNRFKDILLPIKKEYRNKNRIVVITSNFLGKKHAPTKTALERIKILSKCMGKEIVVFNSKEELTQVGKIDFYNDSVPNCIDEYNGLNDINHEDFTFKMYQPSCDTPDYNEYGMILSSIREYAPYEVIVVGDNCVLGDLCADMIPTICMPVTFSDIAYKPYSNQFVMVTHNEVNSCVFDMDKMKQGQFINGVFTFETKKIGKALSRSELGIPSDVFAISIVGIRLHYDISSEFIEAMARLFDKGIHLVFAGHFDNYNEWCDRIEGLKDHSTFVGYQDDMLAFQDICDLYVNPVRLGGGYSIVEAFYMHKPGVTLNYGDVAINAGADFTVSSLQEMVEVIEKYAYDKDFYNKMSEKAYIRSQVLLDGKRALEDILEKMEESPLFF